MRKFMLVTFCGMTLLTACSKDESFKGPENLLEEKNLELAEQLNAQDKKMIALQQTIEALNEQIADSTMEKEQFVFISDLAREFVQAHTTGDQEKLSQLLSANVLLVENENKLYARVGNSDSHDWLLFNRAAKRQLVDWVIQAYAYDGKTQTFSIFIREFYIDSNGEHDSLPTFLGLTFKMYDNEWKIDSLGFDV